MRYSVTHCTTYGYDEDVTNSFGVAHLTPRMLPWQSVVDPEVDIDPEPADRSLDLDYYGNAVTYFQVREPHTELLIEATSLIDVVAPQYDERAFATAWEGARPMHHPGLPGAWLATDMAVASPLIDHTADAAAYGAVSLTPGRGLVEACAELMQRINTDFTYDSAATTVTSTVEEIFEVRGGVCQDFAHLMIACLRTHGLAARYVSGYLATNPPPGQARLVGADASHAWVAVWVPPYAADGAVSATAEGEWVMLDPTNDQWIDDRYVTVGWGRDYGDVPPVKGVIYTEASTSTLSVSVDVAPR